MFSRVVLGRRGYRLGKTIGEGTYSKVKIASSTKHGHNVAIKIVDRRSAPQDFTVKFLSRELTILRTVSHDHIVRLHELIDSTSGRLYIVMELAATDLLERIQQVGRLPEELARTYFTQIVSAVCYLHQNNIVHRDLKCENILLTVGNEVKITDFGFGRFLEGPSDLSSTFCGTPLYAPPEVLLGNHYDPKKSDIWSIGVILYVMLTACMPYDDSNAIRLVRAQRAPMAYPENAALADSCKSFILLILQYHASARPDIQQVAESTWLQPAVEDSDAAAAVPQ
ncbi:testis-specific serine/threonine-protein kinase 6 [Gadus morhua]|uniref:testis-specific serine/threonine-protein kinase 6 n=1 Tax=Gadus morhua TaxID=8049 RepID=UPI0011B5F2D8|nr:testis-specific serine/threonine-protein kinase 6 [Gadus morhua]